MNTSGVCAKFHSKFLNSLKARHLTGPATYEIAVIWNPGSALYIAQLLGMCASNKIIFPICPPNNDRHKQDLPYVRISPTVSRVEGL
jgi:hypothetical protein